MSFKLLVLTGVIVSTVHLQIMDTLYTENANFEDLSEKGEKECNTISYKKEDYKVVKKDPELELDPNCVNDKILEKDGKKFCISGEGNDELQCKQTEGRCIFVRSKVSLKRGAIKIPFKF